MQLQLIGAYVKYLPPYSPVLNPIEQAFSSLEVKCPVGPETSYHSEELKNKLTRILYDFYINVDSFIPILQNFTKAFWLKLQYCDISMLVSVEKNKPHCTSALPSDQRTSQFAYYMKLLLMDKEPANWQRENAFKKQGTLIFLSFHVERHPPPATSKQLILVPDCRRKCMQPQACFPSLQYHNYSFLCFF